ncbi:hypothetical protein [Corynebacterium sp.]|uniref:hypothetical protein n=1 Tax=Corynebacterium sp. TaxID=1720 RepID=UPI0026DAE838|nr:hypothetical protein [Corynebacterium sp.]MDO4611183.1 hypothetical protein [Corynebacterium sp.]
MDELHDDGAWIEAISLFRHVWAGDCVGGMRLLETSGERDAVTWGLLRMLSVFLRGEEPEKVDAFVDAAFRMGPPPGPRPAM